MGLPLSSRGVAGAEWGSAQVDYARVKSLQSCPTHWDPMDHSPPGSSVHGIVQAGMLEWVAISYSDLPNLEMELASLIFLVLVGKFFTPSAIWEAPG